MGKIAVHKHVSSKGSSAAVSLVRAADWNDSHKFASGNNNSILSRDTGQSDGVAWKTPADVSAAIKALLVAIMYPVGSIYFTVDATNPATILGAGTWTAFGVGRVPVTIDSAQAEFDTVEETGGAKTHTLTIGELPSHYHTGPVYNTDSGASGWARSGYSTNVGSVALSNAGGGGAHNNLQPYITCYMWKRTA